MGCVAVAPKQSRELLVAYPGEDCRAGDLVAVEVKDRQHRAVADGAQELVGVPARRQCICLSFAIPDDRRGPEAPLHAVLLARRYPESCGR